MLIYESIFNLIETYIFGTVVTGSYVELVTILLSTIATVFCVAIPFVVVWRVIKYLVGR